MLLNRERALGLMERFAVDALVASTPENITYLTDFVGWSQNVYKYERLQAYAVLPRLAGRAPALIIPGQETAYVAFQRPWVTDIYPYGKPGGVAWPEAAAPATPEQRVFHGLRFGRRFAAPGEALAWVLKDRGLERARIALDEDRCLPAVRAYLREALPGATFLSGASLFRLVRMVKSSEEIRRLRAAAEVNEWGYRAIFRAAKAGVSEEEVAEAWRREVAGPGGMWQWLHFGGAERSCSIFPPSSYRLKRGDLFRFDAGLILNNYHADTGGCGVIGEPTAEQRAMYRAVSAGMQAALEKLRAGAVVSTLYVAAVEATRKNGLPDYDGTFAGHTIGLEAREFPYIVGPTENLSDPFLPTTSDIPLEAGTVLNLEVPCGVFGWGGMQIEYSLVVTASGYEFLIPQERRLEAVG